MAIDNQDHLPAAYLPKRQKTTQNDGPPRLRHDSYSVAWVCALPIEMAAARAMLDETHEKLPLDPADTNTYELGRIAKHNVVIACLPFTQYGTNNATNVATNLKRTFPSIRAALMVGIGGGVPTKADVRLGDVVIGTRVMQYDLGKVVEGGQFQQTAVPESPDQLIGTAISYLRSSHDLQHSRISTIFQQKLGKYPSYTRPTKPDILFKATYSHEYSNQSCDACDPSKVVDRGPRTSDDVTIHYGAIASGNSVIKSARERDAVAEKLDVMCFEMEAAGVMRVFPCLSIRGICDYSDSHKAKEWQRYAAGIAAAYATELLEVLSVSKNLTRADCVLDHTPAPEHRKVLLESLGFEEMKSQKDTILNAHAGTCEWLLRHTEYITWNDHGQRSQHHGFLWISGKPGAGKTTIMKFAFQMMKSAARSRRYIVACFFFKARGAFLERSVLGMYRSLLLQLLEGYPDLQVVLDNPDLVAPNQNKCPPLNVLKQLLYNAIMGLHDRPFVCFIDALDECDEQQALDMVQYFEELAEESTSKGIPLGICFSSRHYPYIVIKRGIKLTLEDQPGHADDIKAYVESRIRLENDILSKEVRQEIFNKASGVFMWAVLVVDIVNDEEQHGGLGPKERLAELPSDLSELFKNIVKRDAKNVQHFILAMLLILYAKRPLRPEEFWHALSFGLHWQGIAVDWPTANMTSLDPSSRAKTLQKCVVGCSKGLAEVTKFTTTVQFIHESVRNFLIKDKGLLELCADLGVDFESSSHERLKQCCDAYLNDSLPRSSIDELRQGGDLSKNEMWVLQEKYPFLEYATQHVLYHANAAAKSIPQDEFLSNFSIPNWVHTANLFERHKTRHHTPNASILYILADGGHPELIRTRLRRDPHIHIPGERYRYPLFAALANSNGDAVAALFNLPSRKYNGVDITQGLTHRKDLKDFEKRTPLSWAAQEGRTEIVQLVLQSGVFVDDVDAGDQTPLSRACETGMDDTARLLIRCGADVNARNIKGETPLGWACANGNLAVAKLLVEEGAAVNVKDIDGETPLFWAARNCDQQIANIFIKEAHVNARDKWGDTPLLVAVQDSRTPTIWSDYNAYKTVWRAYIDTGTEPRRPRKPEQVCKLLVDHKANVNAINNARNTPLSLSLKYGYTDVLGLLIVGGSDVNRRDRFGQTPLFDAGRYDIEATTELLVKNGADINHKDSYGRTRLHLAASDWVERKELVRVLLEHRADPNLGDLQGVTPLHKATVSGHAYVCRLLIKHGADPKAGDLKKSSPLHYAAYSGHVDVYEELIGHGADPNAKDEKRSRPLHEVASYGHADACLVLIRNGAKVNKKDRGGLTPIDIASRKGHQSVVDVLLQNGARRPK